MEGILLVVSGPSGAGKSTVLRAVMDKREDMFFSVSATTRPPRPGEQDGREYFFVTREMFGQMREENRLLEWAEYAGNLYGTPIGPVMDRLSQGQTVVLDIEPNGALQVMEAYPGAVTVFLTPSCEEELERRLRGRGTEPEEKIRRRINIAREEYCYIDRYSYIVLNDTLQTAVRSIEAILTAEGIRTTRNKEHFSKYRIN